MIKMEIQSKNQMPGLLNGKVYIFDFYPHAFMKFDFRSDGSLSLHLGSEIFDVHKQPLQSDFNHLFIRQGTGLQGQAVFKTKLSFRPHSTDSQTHKKMTLSMADRSSKSNQIKVISQVFY